MIFVVLLVSAAMLLGASAVLAGWLGWALLSCNVVIGPVDTPAPICLRGAWPAYLPMPVLSVAAVAHLAVAVGAGVGLATTQVRRARRFADQLPKGEALEAADTSWMGSAETERIRLVDSDRLVAFTAGLWRPQVFLSTGLLDQLRPPETRAVLAHEMAHVRRRDPLRITIVRALARACWPIPVLTWMADRVIVDIEAQADAVALQQESRRALASALLQMLDQPPGQPEAALAGLSIVHERVDLLLEEPPPPMGPGTRNVVFSTTSITLLLMGTALVARALMLVT